ncbi:unnamed protein product, partial [Tetraodon nigroviridis]
SAKVSSAASRRPLAGTRRPSGLKSGEAAAARGQVLVSPSLQPDVPRFSVTWRSTTSG